MQQQIERLLEEKFEYDKGGLEFNCSKIELCMQRGESIEGFFTIHGATGHLTTGKVISSVARMQVLNPDFIGNGEEIHYQFDAEGMEEGEVLKGEFAIISNQGEYYLPFVISIEHVVLSSSLGPIKNLFHFANLAKTSWAEAVSLFYCGQFGQILIGNDKQYQNLYRELSLYPGNEQNMEEFLIEVKKKQRIEYLVEKDSVYLEDPEGVRRESVMITRNGWGYTCLKVETEGTFLRVERDTLTEDNFLGNYCNVEFYVDNCQLHFGQNLGKVRISNSYMQKEITVQVLRTQKEKDALLRHQEHSHTIYQLMTFYEQFRLKKIGTAVWLSETKKLVEKLEQQDGRDVSVKLFQAQLLITEERYNEAKWLLDRIAGQLEGKHVPPELACYYLYLTSLNSREEAYVDQIAEQVGEIFDRYRENWRIAWLMLYLSENYSKSSTKKWLFLEEQFNSGCFSPVLYIEVILLLQQNPALLTKLGTFERYVLYYGVRKQVLTEDLVRQILAVAGQSKVFHPVVLRILEGCYRYRESVETLQALCSYLIRSNCVSSKYFPWYRLGVEREVRVTRLYEYYMLSMDLAYEEEIPKMVMMYFAYQNELDYEKSARLYAQIVKRRNQYPEIFANYREQMERFVLEQIDREHINRDLAYLYTNLVTPQMIHAENADVFSRLLFMNMFTTEYPSAKRVIILHAQAAQEKGYPLTDGMALVPIYTADYTVMFEDSDRNRFCSGIPYNTEKLMLPGKLVQYVEPYVSNSIGFDVYICESRRNFMVPGEENLAFYERVVRDERVDCSYRAEICQKLLPFLYETDHMREMDQLLEQIDFEALHTKERVQTLQFLVLRGNYDMAYAWICRYGADSVDAKTLMKLCSRLIEREDFVPTPQMTELALYAMEHGRMDKVTLGYLAQNYEGLTKKLRDIWKHSREHEMECHDPESRLLTQILYTGAYVGESQELFKSYVSGEYDPALRQAFLLQSAYDYFVREKVMSSYLIDQMEESWKEQGSLQKICKLAYTKYYATEGKEQAGLHQEALKSFLADLVAERIFLPCFKEYVDLVPAARHLYDRTIIEYRAHPNSRVSIHYIVEKEDGEEAEYITEEMKSVFEGVYTKEFILFFGETLQYYIVEERNGDEQLTESATVRKSDIGKEVLESRFSRINDLVISQTLADYSTLDTMLEEYYQTDYYADHLFRLL